MLNFKEYITEGGYHVPVVSLSKEKIDLSKAETRNELNRNLAAELSREWINPYCGFERIRKVLIMYGIALPKVLFNDAEEGEEVIVLSQFGNKVGAKLDGTVSMESDESEYYLYYSYGIGESGFYESYAVVTDEEGLNDLISDDVGDIDEVDYEDQEGDTDPRQP